MTKTLITTLYSYDSIMLICTKLGIEKLVICLDPKPDENQKKAYEMIKKALGNVIEIKTFKIDVYDIVKIAEEAVKCIDLMSGDIYVNVTPSRKTQMLGVLFATYSRIKMIKGIIYVAEENKKMIYLPKLSFDLNNSQRTILGYFRDNKIDSLNDIKIDLSKGMLYRTYKELVELVYLEDFNITDEGRIAIL